MKSNKRKSAFRTEANDVSAANNEVESNVVFPKAIPYTFNRNPQVRRHSLWLPSSMNCWNSAASGVSSYDAANDRVLFKNQRNADIN